MRFTLRAWCHPLWSMQRTQGIPLCYTLLPREKDGQVAQAPDPEHGDRLAYTGSGVA
jgi:hypothetical protein